MNLLKNTEKNGDRKFYTNQKSKENYRVIKMKSCNICRDVKHTFFF